MPQALNKVKRRIATVESTRKITNAMKLISSVKLRQAQAGFNARSEFFSELEKSMNIIANYASTVTDSILLNENKKSSKILYVVVSSSLGLCGSYNYNLTRYFNNVIKDGDEVVVIGDKIVREIEKDVNIVNYQDYKDILNNLTMSNSRVLAHFLLDKYKTLEYSKVVLIYTKYINQIATKVSEYRLLPLQFDVNKEQQLKAPDFEQDINFLVEKMTNKYLTSTLFIKLYESILSEQSSRRNAMDNADKNAEEISDKLKIEYNKARQASITQEITEVVSGSMNK